MGLITAVAASNAAADPCTVEMVRVPDDVVPVIEKWVGAEPTCRVHLAVRVVATDGGYYVLATDPAGVVRERMVPDATTAAVLIASWVADDGATVHAPATQPPTPTPAPSPAPAPVTPVFAQHNPPVTPAWAQSNPPVRPSWAQASPPVKPAWAAAPGGPGATEPTASGAIAPAAEVDRGVARPAHRGALHRLVALGVVINGEGAGVRGEIDLRKLWRVRLGLVAGWTHIANSDHYRDLALDDVNLAAVAGNEFHIGRFDVRATIGAGFTVTTGTHMDTGASQSNLSPFADAAITVGVRVTGRFEVRTGLDVAFMPQRINNGEWFWDRGVTPQWFLGLGYRGE